MSREDDAEASLAELERFLSKQRLRPYLAQARTPEEALRLYETNIFLSAEFLVCAHFLEVALRNEINHLLSAALGYDWFLSKGALLPVQEKQLQTAISQLRKKRKPVFPESILTELPFGFWTALLSSGYERRQQYWRRHLHEGFTHRPAGYDRKQLHMRYNAMRDFRNRIAHHERILHYAPERRLQECLEATGWISPAVRAWAQRLLDKMP